jgi:hypothetical protein
MYEILIDFAGLDASRFQFLKTDNIFTNQRFQDGFPAAEIDDRQV